jgi:hypothetical protein
MSTTPSRATAGISLRPETGIRAQNARGEWVPSIPEPFHLSFGSRHSQCDRWVAQITVAGQNVYLGVYEHLEDAVATRRAAELRYFGEACP